MSSPAQYISTRSARDAGFERTKTLCGCKTRKTRPEPCAHSLPRTHLKNTSARDRSQFPPHQGERTKVNPSRYFESEATQVWRNLVLSHAGCGDFPVPLRCGFVGVAQATPSSPRLADTWKITRNAGWRCF